MERIVCRLGLHSPHQHREELPIITVPGPLGGITGWRGFKLRCEHCGALTLDATLPFWVREWPKPTFWVRASMLVHRLSRFRRRRTVMTDLVARARRLVPELMDGDPAKHLLAELADRVEALIKDRDNWQCQANAQCESARYQQKRIAELESALRALDDEDFLQCERRNRDDNEPACMCPPCVARAALASTPEWKGR